MDVCIGVFEVVKFHTKRHRALQVHLSRIATQLHGLYGVSTSVLGTIARAEPLEAMRGALTRINGFGIDADSISGHSSPIVATATRQSRAAIKPRKIAPCGADF